MKQSDRRKMSASKLAALSATVLLVSLGLCGANVFLTVHYVVIGGPSPQPGQPSPPVWPGELLSITGVLELIGVAFGIAGLLVAWWRSRG